MDIKDIRDIRDAEGGDTLLSAREAAQILRLTEATLATYRSRGVGPRFVRVGAGLKHGRVRYHRADLQAFIREGTPPTKEPEGSRSPC